MACNMGTDLAAQLQSLLPITTGDPEWDRLYEDCFGEMVGDPTDNTIWDLALQEEVAAAAQATAEEPAPTFQAMEAEPNHAAQAPAMNAVPMQQGEGEKARSSPLASIPQDPAQQETAAQIPERAPQKPPQTVVIRGLTLPACAAKGLGLPAEQVSNAPAEASQVAPPPVEHVSHPSADHITSTATSSSTQYSEEGINSGLRTPPQEKRGRGRPRKAPEEKVKPTFYRCRFCPNQKPLQSSEGLCHHMAEQHQIFPLDKPLFDCPRCCGKKFIRMADVNKHCRGKNDWCKFDPSAPQFQVLGERTVQDFGKEELGDTFARAFDHSIANYLVVGRENLPPLERQPLAPPSAARGRRQRAPQHGVNNQSMPQYADLGLDQQLPLPTPPVVNTDAFNGVTQPEGLWTMAPSFDNGQVPQQTMEAVDLTGDEDLQQMEATWPMGPDILLDHQTPQQWVDPTLTADDAVRHVASQFDVELWDHHSPEWKFLNGMRLEPWDEEQHQS